MKASGLFQVTATKLLQLSAYVAFGTSAVLGVSVKQADAALLVGNTAGNNVVLYDETTGKYLGEFITSDLSKNGGLVSPDDLVYGPDGNLYISSGNSSTGKILKYNGKTGAFLGVFAQGGGLLRPYGIAFGPDGNLYVSSFLTDEILRYDAATGAFLDVFASGNGQAGGLNGPNDLLFTADGKLLVSTQGSIAVDGVPTFPGLPSQVLSYDLTTKTSTVLVEQPTPLSDSFDFVSFLGLAFGPDGKLFTSDFANGIRIYSLDEDATTATLEQTIPTNYTGTNPSNNFIGNIAFVGSTLFATGFDFSQGNKGAILRYDGLTGEPLPSAGNPAAIFVPTNGNLLRPIGIAYSDEVQVPEPATAAALLLLGVSGVAFQKRRSDT